MLLPYKCYFALQEVHLFRITFRSKYSIFDWIIRNTRQSYILQNVHTNVLIYYTPCAMYSANVICSYWCLSYSRSITSCNSGFNTLWVIFSCITFYCITIWLKWMKFWFVGKNYFILMSTLVTVNIFLFGIFFDIYDISRVSGSIDPNYFRRWWVLWTLPFIPNSV